MVKIIIDEREISIYTGILDILGKTPKTTISIEKQVLPIGDFIIKMEDESNPICIIERKTFADLLASIKDGRYEEQSYRLSNTECALHNIIYLVEGNINTLRQPEKQLVYSTITSIQLFKGFSIMRTGSPMETVEWLITMSDKIERNLQKKKQLWNNHTTMNIENQSETQPQTAQNYCTVVKKVKKENITQENIGEIMLCQIPGISSTTAIAIMSQYKTFLCLIDALKENPSCLDNIQYNCNGKMRKISKACIENIRKFFLQNN